MKKSMRGPKPDTQTAVIIAMYLDGFDRAYIAKTLGVRYQNVNKALKRFGVNRSIHVLTDDGLQLKEQTPFTKTETETETDNGKQDIIHSEAARRGVREAGNGRRERVLPPEQDERPVNDPFGEDLEGWVSPWVLRH